MLAVLAILPLQSLAELKTCVTSYFHVQRTNDNLSVHGSSDTRDSAQLLIFARRTDTEYEIIEKLATLQSFKGTTSGDNIPLKVSKTLNNLHSNWKELCSVVTDGVARIETETERLNSTPSMQIRCITHKQTLCNKVMKGDL
jgi:hypothetical protein